MINYSDKVLTEFLSCQPPHLAMIRAIEAKLYEKYLPFKGKILDVGCGDGYFAHSVYNQQKIDVGIDVNDSLWQEARDRGNYQKVLVYDGYNIPYKDGEFDTVVSNCVLEHVPEVEKLVKEMSRVTKKGGIVIVTLVTDKFGDELWGTNIFGQAYKNWFNKKSVHNSPYSIEKWTKVFEDNGLNVTEKTAYVDFREMTRFHDISHYWGIPNLITRKLIGKWVWGISKMTNKLWMDKFKKLCVKPMTPIESPYVFIAACK